MVAVSPFTPLKQPDWRWDNSSLLLTTFSDLSSSQTHTPELRILHYHMVPLIPLCHSHPHCVPSPHISTLIPLRFLLLAHCHSNSTLIKIIGTFNIHSDNLANILSFQVLKILSFVPSQPPTPTVTPWTLSFINNGNFRFTPLCSCLFNSPTVLQLSHT